ncbi:MAG: hypothetical protein JXR07_17575, partial [Reichenbachiella sp.]
FHLASLSQFFNLNNMPIRQTPQDLPPSQGRKDRTINTTSPNTISKYVRICNPNKPNYLEQRKMNREKK